LGIVVLVQAGAIAIDSNELVKFLPKLEKAEGFTRGELFLGDDCAECLPTATIYYHKKGLGDVGEDFTDLGKTIVISIIDCKTDREFLADFIKIYDEDQKYMLVQGKYEGKSVIIQNEYGTEECNYMFSVNNRFLIHITGGIGNVTKEMDILLNHIDYRGLENLQ
jgi:hypothetical protein